MAKGFTLIETLFAAVVTVVALVALARLTVVATHANRGAVSSTFTIVLAAQKVEQLRSLAWTFDAAGQQPRSDTSTDTANASVAPGGTGLTASSGDTLETNIVGYCDFLDHSGRSLGGGSAPPAGTVFVRRWSIGALASSSDTLVIQVLVTPLAGRGEEARLMSLRTRKGT
jgi:type II secretory pathway pseudopilin PulG